MAMHCIVLGRECCGCMACQTGPDYDEAARLLDRMQEVEGRIFTLGEEGVEDDTLADLRAEHAALEAEHQAVFDIENWEVR